MRVNNATRAEFQQHDLDHPFSEGAFRWVAHGIYTEGPRSGQHCVCKWFKSGSVFEADFFEHDIRAVSVAKLVIVHDY